MPHRTADNAHPCITLHLKGYNHTHGYSQGISLLMKTTLVSAMTLSAKSCRHISMLTLMHVPYVMQLLAVALKALPMVMQMQMVVIYQGQNHAVHVLHII